MKFHQKLFLCVDRAHYTSIAGIYVMMLFIAGLEVACAMLFLPFLAALEGMERLSDYSWFMWLVESIERPPTQQTAIVVCCAMLLLAYVVKNLVMIWFKYQQATIVRTLHASMALRLLKKCLTQNYIAHLSRNSADLLRNINQDTNNIVTNIVRAILVTSVEAVVAMGLLAMLFIQNFKVTLVAIVIFGALSTTIYKLTQRYTYVYGERSRSAYSEMVKWTLQSIGSLKETKVMHKEPYFLDRYSSGIEKYKRASIKFAMVHELPRLALETIGITTILAMTLIIIYDSSREDALPTLSLFAIAAFRMLPSLNRIMASLSQARFHSSALDQVADDLLAAQTDHTTPISDPFTFKDAIEFDRVTFSYDGTEPTINECTLRINKGQTVAFVGSSGAGKTTLIDLLIGLLDRSEGDIIIDGKSIDECVYAWQSQVGYISQPVYMLNDTVLRNVAFGREDQDIDEETAWRALEQAQLADAIRALPDGLHTEIGESGARLSGGQRQRIGIARVLYYDPEVLVFDEATSALDNETEAEITRAIEHLSSHKTVIMIAHRFSTIQHCDVIFMLQQGSVLAQGTYDELMETCPEFNRLATASAESLREEDAR